MNKRFIRILVLLILIGVTTTAIAATSGAGYNWESANIKIVETVTAGDQTTLTLWDNDQHLFKVSYPGNNLPDDVGRYIIKYETEFFSWRNLEMKEIKFVLSLDILEIIIIPTQIMYNGNNIVDAIPAGIVFIFDPASPGSGLLYDFKILKNNLILRVTGKYATETEFDKNLFRIYENPKNHLEPSGTRATQPTKLVETTPTPTGKPLRNVTGTPTVTPTKKPAAPLTGAPTKRPTGPEATTLPTQSPLTPTPTGSTGTTLTNADFEFLLDKIIQLQVENERLRYALLSLENKGLFDKAHPISREVILQVIQLKRQYPTLTFRELFSQLKKEGVQITKQELYLILAVYFNEFYDQEL